ncbi:MAG: hypothetical protein QCH96_05870 [Candidatus Thermoplasmatota archaeon]|nr:hypothetical protein [Candidatus Thermoplasmatota archaeon]
MIVAGLLSTQSEVQEIQFIITVCTVRDRIRLVARKEAIKKLLQQEKRPRRTPSKH